MSNTNDLATTVQELVWALIDEQATPEQLSQLEQLCLESDEARQVYIRCIQMHADLRHLLGGMKPVVPLTPPAATGKPAAPLPLVDLPPLTPGAGMPGLPTD